MEYLGEPFLEFGIFTSNPYELRRILQTIEESHPHNRIKETFLIQKEFLSVGPPPCLFEEANKSTKKDIMQFAGAWKRIREKDTRTLKNNILEEDKHQSKKLIEKCT
jgi:hypothetical protein